MTNKELITIQEWLQKNTRALENTGIESARLDCLLLLESELKKSREWILAHSDTELDSNVEQKLNKMCARRQTRQPLAYIIGSKEFYGHDFFVNKDVLIPRPESEAIIELLKEVVLSEQWRVDSEKPTTNHQPPTIIDIGTGSGCLAITAKLEFPDLHVIATDVSDAALSVARKNAKTLHADIEFKKSDLLSSLPPLHSSIYLANLPYVPNNLITSEEITKEPAEALFSGSDGLDHYQRFWQQIEGLKNKPRAVIIESLKQQHPPMIELAQNAGYHLATTNTLCQLYTLS